MHLSFETLTSIIKAGQPILVELIDLVNSVIFSNGLSQMVNFPTRIPDLDSHSPTLQYFFLSSDASMAFLPLGKFDHVVVSVSIDFPTNSKQDALCHLIPYEYSCADYWDGLCDHLRDVSWGNIFKLSASAAASE